MSCQILLLRILFPVLYSLEEAAVGALETSALWDSIVLKHRGGLIGSQLMAITIYHKTHARANSQMNYYCRSCLSLMCARSYPNSFGDKY